jgi:dynein heavy chain
LSEKIGIALKPDDKFTLTTVFELQLNKHMESIVKIGETAGKEFAIETQLDKMEEEWQSVMLQIEDYRDTGTFILKGFDEYMAILDEQITTTQAMTFSSFKGPFEERIDNWDKTLGVVSEVLDEWIAVQRNWLYLEPIFSSDDINKQLPVEGKRFATVDKNWRTAMARAKSSPLAIKYCNDEKLLERFQESNKFLDMVQKGLSEYLETKRAGFSRFYFLSNDELLEILSETKDPKRVQGHLKKCFEGIKSVHFEPSLEITGMKSSEGEVVAFEIDPVDPKGKNIENWMTELCASMRSNIRKLMYLGITDYKVTPRMEWVKKWPAMVVLNGSQVHWTSETEEAIKQMAILVLGSTMTI